MLRIRTDGSIRVTRGDTAQIEVRAYGQDGDDFDLSQWSATMTVRVPDASGAVLFSEKAAAGTHPVVSISATDTAKVANGGITVGAGDAVYEYFGRLTAYMMDPGNDIKVASVYYNDDTGFLYLSVSAPIISFRLGSESVDIEIDKLLAHLKSIQ